MFGLNFFSSSIKATGAFENSPDVRDISISAIQKDVELPKEHITDISKLKVLDQGNLGTCVAHAFSSIMTNLNLKETGNATELSRRMLYSLTRKTYEYTDDLNEGLFPRDCAKIVTKVGTTDDISIDNNKLPHSSYVALNVDSKMQERAEIYRGKAYGSVDADDFALMQAIVQNGLVAVSIQYDPKTWSSGGEIRKVKSPKGRHYIVLYGYKTIENDVVFYFLNSWGKVGVSPVLECFCGQTTKTISAMR